MGPLHRIARHRHNRQRSQRRRSNCSHRFRQRYRRENTRGRRHGACRSRSGMHRLVRQDERNRQSGCARSDGAADSDNRQGRHALLPQRQVLGHRCRQSHLRRIPDQHASHQKHRHARLTPLPFRSRLHHPRREKRREGQTHRLESVPQPQVGPESAGKL